MKSFIIALGVSLLFGGSASSELLETDLHTPGDALLTRDTATGLEWLDLTLTFGRSFKNVSSQFGPGGEFQGFRYATPTEITTFWRNAGIVDIDLPGFLNFTAANLPGAIRLRQMVGSINSPNGSFSLMSGISGPVPFPSSGLLPTPVVTILNQAAEARTNGVMAFFWSASDTGSWLVRLAPRIIEMDVKPDSCPNRLNPKGHGVLSVALLGEETFNVDEIDLSTIELSRGDGAGDTIGPLFGPPSPGPELNDLGGPVGGQSCDCPERGGADGILDLALKFSVIDLAAALRLDEASEEQVELVVRGQLINGTRFEAQDCILLTK